MLKTKVLLLIISTAILTSCATTSTGPIAAGKNTYVISRQEGAFPSGNVPLLAEAIGEANVFCATQSKEVKIVDTHERSGPFILGNYPKATVTFSCIDATSAK